MMATMEKPEPNKPSIKRDYLIKQVVNTNNLRKIDDSIRRTIMVKLNRETVSLTWGSELAEKIKKISSYQTEITSVQCWGSKGV